MKPDARNPDPETGAQSAAARKHAGGWGETLRTVVYAVLIALFVRTFAFEPFNIPSGSMKPTLLIGDYPLRVQVLLWLQPLFAPPSARRSFPGVFGQASRSGVM